MNANVQMRIGMALLGAFAAATLYYLADAVDHDLLGERMALAAISFSVVFFGGAMSLTGPLSATRAMLSAAALALVVSALLSWAGLRFVSLADLSPFAVGAAMVLATLPLPFFIAAAGPGWGDYRSLFTESWSLFVRLSLAGVFVGVVWGVIMLSNALFGLIGLTLIEDLLAQPIAPWLIVGTTFGLALAVVNELSDYVSPFLILRLLRLLAAPVLLVLLVFVGALPLRGLSGLFGGLSSAGVLLGMVAAAATLIAAVVDQSDEEAGAQGWNARATRALAVLVLVPAALAAFALWLRVAQYGWTPQRLFAAWMAVLALGYGVFYIAAALQRQWRARIRAANIGMALALIGSAALWLTPVLNPEAISARSQMARFEAAGRKADVIDVSALSNWGMAGAAARATLETIAVEPGQEALAARLKGDVPNAAMDAPTVRAALVEILPVQPATATVTRDAILAAADPSLLNYWLASCQDLLPSGARGCVMVVADLWPEVAGPEAMMITASVGGYINYAGLTLDANGLHEHPVQGRGGSLPDDAEGFALLRTLQTTPLVTQAVPMNQIVVGTTGLMMAP